MDADVKVDSYRGQYIIIPKMAKCFVCKCSGMVITFCFSTSYMNEHWEIEIHVDWFLAKFAYSYGYLLSYQLGKH